MGEIQLILTSNLAAGGRRAFEGGREFVVARVRMLPPEGVLNGSKGPGLYPAAESAKNPAAWDGMPLVYWHPVKDGRHVSALANPDVLASHGVGELRNTAYNHNSGLESEAWFDVERVRAADRRFGTRVLNQLEAGQPIEVSTGLFTDNEPAPRNAVFNGRDRQGRPFSTPYTWVARNYRPDHLAVLPDQRGACSIDHGCGINVNAAQKSVGLLGNARPRKPSAGLGVTPEKACKIVKDGSVHGRPLTAKQRGMFGARCGQRGKKVMNLLRNANPEGCNQHTGPGCSRGGNSKAPKKSSKAKPKTESEAKAAEHRAKEGEAFKSWEQARDKKHEARDALKDYGGSDGDLGAGLRSDRWGASAKKTIERLLEEHEAASKDMDKFGEVRHEHRRKALHFEQQSMKTNLLQPRDLLFNDASLPQTSPAKTCSCGGGSGSCDCGECVGKMKKKRKTVNLLANANPEGCNQHKKCGSSKDQSSLDRLRKAKVIKNESDRWIASEDGKSPTDLIPTMKGGASSKRQMEEILGDEIRAYERRMKEIPKGSGDTEGGIRIRFTPKPGK